MLTGTIVNTCTVIAGSVIGMLLGNILPERLRDTVMKGLGLCTLYIGITGMFGSENALITIISIAVGAVIGELCDLDGLLNRFANWLEGRFKRKNGSGKASIAEGFITASLVFCVGAMTIVGSLNSGLTGDHQMLYTKATLDFVSSMIFASSRIWRTAGCRSGLCDPGRHRLPRQLCGSPAPARQHHHGNGGCRFRIDRGPGSESSGRYETEGHELCSGHLPADPAVYVHVIPAES